MLVLFGCSVATHWIIVVLCPSRFPNHLACSLQGFIFGWGGGGGGGDCACKALEIFTCHTHFQCFFEELSMNYSSSGFPNLTQFGCNCDGFCLLLVTATVEYLVID